MPAYPDQQRVPLAFGGSKLSYLVTKKMAHFAWFRGVREMRKVALTKDLRSLEKVAVLWKA